MEVSNTVLYSLLGMVFFELAAIGYFLFRLMSIDNHDHIILIDRNNRWSLIRTMIRSDTTKYVYKKKSYFLSEQIALLNNKGKALYIFSENKPMPMKLTYNKYDWLDSESIMSIINNELVKQIVKPVDSLKDTLLLFGAIGGIIAGLSSVLILLNQTGVLNVGGG